MSIKKNIEWPEVPDFRDYGHGWPARATQIKIGMPYWGSDTVVRPVVRFGSAFQVEAFNVLTGKWEQLNFLIGAISLSQYDKEMFGRLEARRTRALREEANQRKQAQARKVRGRKQAAETEFFQEHGVKLNAWYESNGDPKLKVGKQIHLTLTPSEYRKLKKLMEADPAMGAAEDVLDSFRLAIRSGDKDPLATVTDYVTNHYGR